AAKTHATPSARLTFKISSSERATTIAKRLRYKRGRLRVEEANFAMKAGGQQLRESYLLTAGFFDDGTPMDHEQIRDLLELHCTDSTADYVETSGFDVVLAQQLEELSGDVEDRNARFFLEQEALLDASRLDNAQDALQAKQSRQVLFSINWEVK